MKDRVDMNLAKQIARRSIKGLNMPPCMESSDLLQEAYLFMLEHEEKPPQYFQTAAPLKIKNIAQSLVIAPPTSVLTYNKKKGVFISYGEVSLESFGDEDGTSWEEYFPSVNGGDASESRSPTPSSDCAKKCLEDIQEQISAANDMGIYWNKAISKYTVDLLICGKRQRVSSKFKTIEEARAGKRASLFSFRDYVLAAIDDESPWLLAGKG